MKVLVGHFSAESNANIPHRNTLADYQILFGQECIEKTGFADVFLDAGMEVIPVCYASAGPSGIVRLSAFRYLEDCFLNTVREHLNEIDGMCFFFHGATEVEEIGSGEHHLLHEIRRITGPYLPIAISCDPHGNLSEQYVQDCTIIRDFRESPHTDILETKRKVAAMLAELLNDRHNIHCIYRKLPLILGGEQSVSADEPVKSINAYMDEMEKDPRVRSASWHVGYIRHDSPAAGCGIVVIPQKEQDQEYCEGLADQLAEYVWNRRHEFHYTGLALPPEEAMETALQTEGKPVFLTDSGDNVTSGSMGWNTFVLRQALALKENAKRFLFANFRDQRAFDVLKSLPEGAEADIELGPGTDEMSKTVSLRVKVRRHGVLYGDWMNHPEEVKGESVLVSVVGKPIDLNITAIRHNLCQIHQFRGAGIDPGSYDIIVVREGYIFPELKKMGVLSIMSLTEGATMQDTAHLRFKRIMRPMYPIDNI